MEDFKEIILYYKNYLLKKEKANLCEINIKSNENIKKYMEIYDNPEDLEKALDVSRATLNRKLLKYDLR